MPRRIILVLALVAAAAAAWGAKLWLERPDPKVMAVFEGVDGPRKASRIKDAARTRLAEFDRGGDHRLAILVTDPESGWLGLVRGFQAHGVPITVTQDVDKALRHDVVLVYPIISGQVLQGPQLRRLAEHVRAGGTVVAFNLAGGGLGELFGMTTGPELSSRTRLVWTEPQAFPEEQQIAVSSRGEARVSSVGYSAGAGARVMATFDDGAVAAACRTVGGQACVLGVDVGSLAQRAMNGRAGVVGREYVNGYEPSLDMLFRWLRDRYVAGETMPWLVSTAPAGKQVSILFTHDIDAQDAPANAVTYAQALKARGVTATFFVQTKYMKDFNDIAFFNSRTAPDVRRLVDLGMDVGSHTVAHSLAFDSMPMGNGKERYPTYRPFVENDTTVRGATILGELRVSKSLLDKLAGAEVTAFRPGRLSYPFSLPQALAATGYRQSSSITANSVLTHLPFQLTDGRADAALQPVWEFPVAIEDEAPPRLGDRIDAADVVIGKIARDHGVATILIHPNITGHKLAFEAAIADRWAGRAWMGSVRQFGDWWIARNGFDSDVAQENGRWVLHGHAREAVGSLGVVFPKAGGREMVLNLAKDGRVAVAAP